MVLKDVTLLTSFLFYFRKMQWWIHSTIIIIVLKHLIKSKNTTIPLKEYWRIQQHLIILVNFIASLSEFNLQWCPNSCLICTGEVLLWLKHVDRFIIIILIHCILLNFFSIIEFNQLFCSSNFIIFLIICLHGS